MQCAKQDKRVAFSIPVKGVSFKSFGFMYSADADGRERTRTDADIYKKIYIFFFVLIFNFWLT